MRNAIIKYAGIAALLLVGSIAEAELAVPRLTGRVVDNAKMLSGSHEQRITAALQNLEQAPKGAQMAVLTIPSLKGDSLDLFSMRVVESWKLGKKDTDNGLLLLISRDDRKMRLETAYGLEGRLTDARCGDIIRSMGPYFKEQRFGDGILFAIGQVQLHLTGSTPAGMPQPIQPAKRKSSNISPFLILLFFFIIPAILRSRFGWGHAILLGSSGFRSSGFGGGFGGGGGFSGGGGSFGGGGASGSW